MTYRQFSIVELFLAGAMFATVATLFACPPPKPAPIPVDASDAASTVDSTAPYDDAGDGPLDDDAPLDSRHRACSAMRAAGCREGAIADCAAVLERVNSDPHFAHFDLGCLSSAKSAAAVKACGMSCTP